MFTAWSPTRSRSALIFMTRGDEAQVDGHGLLHGQQVEGEFVDLALHDVDGGFAIEHQPAQLRVPPPVTLDGALHGLLGHAAHGEQLLPQLIQSLMKTRAHYPNLPVM